MRRRYVTSMYWAMSTMATVGYGDVTPIQISEKIVAMVGMLVGVTIFAYDSNSPLRCNMHCAGTCIWPSPFVYTHSHLADPTCALCRYIMSTVSSLLTTFNAQSIRAQETQQQLDSFCRSHKLPTVLARKLNTYYDYVLPRTVHAEDLDLVSGLSAALRQQVWQAFAPMRC